MKYKFLIGTVTAAGLGTGGYFSVKSLVFDNFWDSKVSKLQDSIKKLSSSDYENVESSVNLKEVGSIVEEMLSWLEEKVGAEKFENTFLKLLGYENLSADSASMTVVNSGVESSIQDKIKELKKKIEVSENDFYEKLNQLNNICKKVVKEFEDFKKSKRDQKK